MTKLNDAVLGEQLRAIAEPTRYKIIQLLLKKHHCSRSLALALGISESAVSQHMSVLKEQQVVTSFRHGHHVHYVISKEVIGNMAQMFASWAEQVESIGDCHESNPCQYRLDDGLSGCLYAAKNNEK